ncbi:MAG: peptidoglycan DD-metalloendopeptidase family protein [Desulforhopalus sp.]|nr:peptidoglycan DD-metalloendopeptidase family protein [Desulforhopalus sp.]
MRIGGIRVRKGSSFIPFVFIFIIVLLVTTTPPLFGQNQKTTDTTEKNVSDFRGKINRLQQGILQQETKITETQTTERNILTELEALDIKLVIQQEKLEALELKMRQQQAMIDREENALSTIRSDKFIVKDHLKKRITAYYTMGDIGLLNVTFSTKTLPELLTFHDAFDALIKYDQDIIKVYQDTIEELVRVTAALDLEKSILEDFLNQINMEKEILKKTKADKNALLTQVRTQEELHKRAIIEMQQASKELAKSIVSMKNKGQIYEQGFLADKGRLPPPVNGILITLFHQEKSNKLGISRYSEGIELQAADGTKIVSVSDGDVIFSGYLRGYGNTVIIHHGFQYYTVTARIEKILVEKGQKVEQEDSIGIMGDTATLFDEGLYFEIRHGRESLDPLLWLNPNRLSNLQVQHTDKVGVDKSVH